MRTLIYSVLLGSVLLILPSLASATNQPATNFESTLSLKVDTLLPKVFLLGEHEEDFEKMSLKYSTLLLTTCDNDLPLAFDKWMSMIREMEAYSETLQFDLRGTKMWLYFFWNEDGSIEHIAYYLRPNSKNIDTAELNAFFKSFISNYRFPLMADTKYSHYGNASFPTFSKYNPAPVSGSNNPNIPDKDSLKK